MAGLNSARAKGRDAKRISDIKTLQKSLELYFDTCGGYPKIGPAAGPAYATIGIVGGLLVGTQDGDCLTSGKTFGSFMATLPTNPAPGGTPFGYCSTADGAAVGVASCDVGEIAGYQISFSLEGTTGSLASGLHTATPSGIL
jgi:hypothetical protein